MFWKFHIEIIYSKIFKKILCIYIFCSLGPRFVWSRPRLFSSGPRSFLFFFLLSGSTVFFSLRPRLFSVGPRLFSLGPRFFVFFIPRRGKLRGGTAAAAVQELRWRFWGKQTYSSCKLKSNLHTFTSKFKLKSKKLREVERWCVVVHVFPWNFLKMGLSLGSWKCRCLYILNLISRHL